MVRTNGYTDWNGNGKYPSNHLRDCLEARESFVEEKFKSDYSKLRRDILKQSIPWSSVQESINLGSTAQEISLHTPKPSTAGLCERQYTHL